MSDQKDLKSTKMLVKIWIIQNRAEVKKIEAKMGIKSPNLHTLGNILQHIPPPPRLASAKRSSFHLIVLPIDKKRIYLYLGISASVCHDTAWLTDYMI